MKTRLVPLLLFSVMAMLVCSCATQDVIAKAQGIPGPMDPPNQPPTQPMPAYYALVPLVLPFDLVFWPVEYFYMQNRAPYNPPPAYYQQTPAYQNSAPPPYAQPYRPTPPPGVTWQE